MLNCRLIIRVKDDTNDIKSYLPVVILLFHIDISSIEEHTFLGWSDGLRWLSIISIAASLYLYKDQCFIQSSYDIYLGSRVPIVAR